MADAVLSFFLLFFYFCGGGSENVQEFTLQLLEVEIFFVDTFWLKPRYYWVKEVWRWIMALLFSIAGPTGDSGISRRNEEKEGFIPSRKGSRWRKGGIMRYVIIPIMMIKDASKLEPDGYFACCRCA